MLPKCNMEKLRKENFYEFYFLGQEGEAKNSKCNAKEGEKVTKKEKNNKTKSKKRISKAGTICLTARLVCNKQS